MDKFGVVIAVWDMGQGWSSNNLTEFSATISNAIKLQNLWFDIYEELENHFRVLAYIPLSLRINRQREVVFYEKIMKNLCQIASINDLVM